MDNIFLIYAIVLTLVISAIGFKKTVWFVSIGYALSILLLAFATFLAWNTGRTAVNYIQLLGLFVWASRLGYFLFMREKNSAYNSAVKDQTDASQNQPFLLKVVIWISVALLYVCMFFPALLAANSNKLNETNGILIWIGAGVIWLGVILESIADRQKANFKKKYPYRFCDTGLFKWVRCPNYLGEILVWTGNTLIGITVFTTWWHWVMAFVGWTSIVLIMMGSTKRLESKQNERYGNDPKFQDYIKTVPVLFPWVRVYSLKNVKVYLE